MFLLYIFFYIFMGSVVITVIDRYGDVPEDAIGVLIIGGIFWPLTILLAAGIGFGILVVNTVCGFFEKKKKKLT
jgi:hypothetical protein